MKIKALIAATLGFFLLASNAAEKSLTVYDCQGEWDVSSCGGSCKPRHSRAQTKFKVNKEERAVLEVAYVDGRQTKSTTLQNCVIFDDKNWDCTSESKLSFADIILIDVRKMTDGVFVSYGRFVPPPDGKQALYSCAK